MTRITLWGLSTLSVVVLLFGYSTSTAGPQATSAPTSIYSTGTSGSTGTAPSSSSSGSTSSGSASSGSTSSGSTSSGSTSGAGTATGDVAQTQWGPVQVELKIASGKITGVDVLQYPNGNPRDAQINSYALPILTQETISAQSARIDMVSGATVTSDGYLQSRQSALDKAGL